MKKCRHKWSDICTGIRTGQCERQCLKCKRYQHTYRYYDGKWLDGPMLDEPVFKAYCQGYADALNGAQPGM